VAGSTEPGVIEVFALSEGRLVAHRGFGVGDLTGLSGFAEEVLARREEPRADAGEEPARAADEARVVAAYLRRRSAAVEAVPLGEARDLLEAVSRVVGGAGDGASPSSW
jgi:DNA polymerase III subunit epsilon